MAIEQPGEDRQPPHRDVESGLEGASQPETETRPLPTTESLQAELRQVQQALAESQNGEQLLVRLFESAMDAIISVDEGQCIVLFNPAAERMFGLSVSEAIGQPIDALLPEQARRHHAEHIRTFARTGVPSRQLVGPGCVQGRRANGELFPVEASISQIKVQGRRLFTVILRDISRRIHDEQALRESEERLTLFAATTFEGIVISERGRIIDCNEQFARMTGHTVRELAGRLIEELVVPEDREHIAENIRQGRESIVEHAMLRKDGERIFVETHGKTIPVGSPGGRRMTAVRDITERKRIEQALQERTERYELVLAGAQSAIWDWDVPGRRVHFSAQWKALRGFSDNEVGDGEEEWSASIHPEDAARVMAAVEAHFLGKTPVFAEEYRIRCKDGSLKWIGRFGKRHYRTQADRAGVARQSGRPESCPVSGPDWQLAAQYSTQRVALVR
jgi:PAS domain S-box-containing protein